MKTRKEQMTSGGIDGYSNFLGDDSEYRNWFGIIGQSRDSDCLERSNFRIALELLGGESDTVRVERYGHWACGWIEEIYVKPDSEAYLIAQTIEKQLDNYPVLDEDDFSNLESEEADEIWANCYNSKERAQYIRHNRSQFEFNSFRDLWSCVKGQYFAGYASELVGR